MLRFNRSSSFLALLAVSSVVVFVSAMPANRDPADIQTVSAQLQACKETLRAGFEAAIDAFSSCYAANFISKTTAICYEALTTTRAELSAACGAGI